VVDFTFSPDGTDIFLKEKTEKKKAPCSGQARLKSKGSDRFKAGRHAGRLNGRVHCFFIRVKALRGLPYLRAVFWFVFFF